MSLVRRVAIAGVLAAMLAAVALVAPSTAQASRHVIASTKAMGNLENYYLGNVAVQPDGRAALALSSAGLTKYAISGTSVRRLGTTKIWKQGYANGPQVHIHPGGAIAYVLWDKAIRVFDITGSKPRVIRTLHLDEMFGDHPTSARDGDFAPDGRHFYLLGDRWLQVLDTRHPGRPARGEGSTLPADAYSMSVTPNGRALVLGGRGEDRATVLVYTLKDAAAPVLARQGHLEVAGWSTDASTQAVGVVARNGSVYVELATWRENDQGYAYALLRVRRSDLGVIAQMNEGEHGSPFLGSTSPAGHLVYLTYGFPDSESTHWPQHLVRTDAALGATHAITGVGDVVHLAVSPGGRTKGLLVAIVLHDDTGHTPDVLRLKLVDPR